MPRVRGKRGDSPKHNHRQGGSRKPALTLDDLRARRNEILAIAARRGAHNIRVFGSVARGEARPDSDIDFLVEMDPNRSALDLAGLGGDLEDVLGHEVDVVEIWEPSPAARRILLEAVPL